LWSSAGTKGLCSLTVSNLELWKEGDTCWLKLDFFGKSSIPFTREKDIPIEVYQKLDDCIQDKEEDDLIFHRVKVNTLIISAEIFSKACVEILLLGL
jgi:hypothetical protein